MGQKGQTTPGKKLKIYQLGILHGLIMVLKINSLMIKCCSIEQNKNALLYL